MADYAAEDAAYKAAVAAEWGVYVANGSVAIDGVLAFTDGSPVPTSTAERLGLEADGYVRKVGTPKPVPVTAVVAPPEGEPIFLNQPVVDVPIAASDPSPDAPPAKK